MAYLAENRLALPLYKQAPAVGFPAANPSATLIPALPSGASEIFAATRRNAVPAPAYHGPVSFMPNADHEKDRLIQQHQQRQQGLLARLQARGSGPSNFLFSGGLGGYNGPEAPSTASNVTRAQSKSSLDYSSWGGSKRTVGKGVGPGDEHVRDFPLVHQQPTVRDPFACLLVASLSISLLCRCGGGL